MFLEPIKEIGSFMKPHGISGEIVAVFDDDIDDEIIDRLKCVVVEADGTFVPYFIESHRPKGYDSELIKLEDINSDRDIKPFSNKAIFVPISSLPEDLRDGDKDSREGGMFASDLIGWSIYDGDSLLGKIIDIDVSTPNELFIVERDGSGERLLVPIADEFITSISPEDKLIEMNLPTGLTDL